VPNYQHVGFGGRNLPVPKLQQINENGTRVYATPDGSRYPSVTTILSELGREGLDRWRDRIGHEEAARIGARAAARGTKLHMFTEHWLQNDQSVFTGVDLIGQHFFEEFKPLLTSIDNIHCLETKLYSHHLRLAGTVDCIAEYNGQLSVIDFKTASKPKRHDWIHSYFMQTAAYAIMYEELTGIPVPQLVILVAVEDSEPQVFTEPRNRWTQGLIDCRNIYEKSLTNY
jgi:genome maintenance exonuclease 1